MTSKNTISAFIVCMNEEDSIERCLKSVAWCDEIIIVDSGSKDKTIEICNRYTDQVIHNDWPGYREQKEFALSKCNSEWILNIDADEEVSLELQERIKKIVKANTEPAIDGYQINRVLKYLGFWWREGGWHPEYRLRLCRKAKTSWGGSNIHEHAVVDGKIGKIKEELYHYSFDSIKEHSGIVNKYSSLLTAEIIEKKRNNFLVLRMILNPIARFIKFYIFRKGYKYGTAGFIAAIVESFYVFLKYAKVWEKKNSNYDLP